MASSALALLAACSGCGSSRDGSGGPSPSGDAGGGVDGGGPAGDGGGPELDGGGPGTDGGGPEVDGGGLDAGPPVDCGADPCPLSGGEPRFVVRFTTPVCDAIPASGVPSGVRCYGERAEVDASRTAAGITNHIVRWLDDARRTKVLHPERDVRITMAYLTWSDGAIYRALCSATAAGVKFSGFFDRGDGGDEPPRLAADATCHPENIEINYLGGVTAYPDWRLMHVKMLMIEHGTEVSRLVLGSANMSAYGQSVHFENWVFAEFPADGHVIAAHRCAADALYADRYVGASTTYPAVFRERYDDCVASIPAAPDPRFRVFFSPDPDTAALQALLATMRGATGSVDVAAQHLSSPDFVRQIAMNGMSFSLAVRVLLDDDTYYDLGDTGGVDHTLYQAFLVDSGALISFLQTNYFLGVGAQYQHNKYVVVDGSTLVFGAGNFTSVGFTNNYENYYVATYPALVSEYESHFEALFGLGKSADELPVDPMF